MSPQLIAFVDAQIIFLICVLCIVVIAVSVSVFLALSVTVRYAWTTSSVLCKSDQCGHRRYVRIYSFGRCRYQILHEEITLSMVWSWFCLFPGTHL